VQVKLLELDLILWFMYQCGELTYLNQARSLKMVVKGGDAYVGVTDTVLRTILSHKNEVLKNG